MRNTGTSLKPESGDGALRGNKGLGFDITRARVRDDGKIVGVPKGDSLEELLRALEDPEHSDVDAIADLKEGLGLAVGNPEELRSRVIRLRRLVSALNNKTRIVAVRTLGKTDDFENIPYLIYALTDPDIKVARIAESGLRQISRRLDGVGISFENLDGQQKAAVKAWKLWYQTVNPDAIFIE